MHISIIDDEKILSEKIAKKVRNSGFSASSFSWFHDFMKNGDEKSGLYIIDLSLRDGNGIDIVKWLRKNRKSSVPIIIISGHGDPQNIISGLDSGSDDYIVKPFSPDELIARIKAVLRRPGEIHAREVLVHNSIRFDLGTRETYVGGRRVHLTRTEQLILEIFMGNVGTMVGKEKIISHVWGGCNYMDFPDNTLSVHISNMKRKLWADFSIQTEYSNGYMLKP